MRDLLFACVCGTHLAATEQSGVPVSTSFDLLFRPPAGHACSLDGVRPRAAVPAPLAQGTTRSLHGSLWSDASDLDGKSQVLSPRAAVPGVFPAPAGTLAAHFSSSGTEVGK